MTPDEHQRERMRHWSAVQVKVIDTTAPNLISDHSLAEFDKRFPAPAAVEVAPEMHDDKESEMWAELREKARLWDAVASWKVILSSNGTTFYATWKVNPGYAATPHFTTAAEAVQAAIDAGALK